MLNLLDESLKAFLRATVPLPGRQVDISFDAPDKDWGAGVTKPTVNLFLWDVRRNADEKESGFEIVEDEEGNKTRRPPMPRIDCRYVVTAWTNEIRDEHALLGQVLTTLLQHDTLSAEHLQGAYAPVRPIPTLSVAAADGDDQTDFWSALGGQLKPGLDLLVTATVDAGIMYEVGPPVDRYEIGIADSTTGDRVSEALFIGGRSSAVGGTVVLSPRATARTRGDGDFLIRAEPGDEITVDSESPERGKVPKQGPVKAT